MAPVPVGWERRGGGRVPWLLLLVLIAAACRPAEAPSVPPRPVPARLVVADSRDPVRPWLGTLARPVDPDTLADLPGFAPTELSGCGSTPAVRPDGRVLAVVVGWLAEPAAGQPVACNTGGGVVLRLFDLVDWRWLGDTGVRSEYSIGSVTWSLDGRRLYALTSTRERGALGGLGGPDEVARLWVVDTTNQAPPASVPLPFAVQRLEVAPDGTPYLLAYRLSPTDRAFIALDPALLVGLDPATGAERARVPLPGVKVAQRRETGPDGRVVAYPYYTPGLAFAPDGRRAYVARADEPLLDVVDLVGGRIERTVDLAAAAAGPLEHLLDLFAHRAEAKGNPTATASLALSADGRTLYIGREDTAFEPTGQPKEAREVRKPAGLVALDTVTWRARPLAGGPAGPSRDGRWLYAAEADRVRVLDPATGAEAATLPVGHGLLQLVDAGDRLYLAVATADYHGTQPYRADERLVELVAYEAGTWREVARRAGHLNLRLPLGPW